MAEQQEPLDLESIGVDHLKGTVPAPRKAAEGARDAWYESLRDGRLTSCIPSEHVHVWEPGTVTCQCGRWP